MEYKPTIYMDQRDVTDWILKVDIEQIDSIHRKFLLTFAGWHSFDETNRWDIFESYDPSNPRQEITIRNGIIPADRTRMVKVSKGDVPTITAEGYEYIWLAKRRAPQESVVLVPSTRNIDRDVAIALRNYHGNKKIGTYRVWPGVRTLHGAITRLMKAARIRAQIRIPDYPLQPYVLGPELSYWAAVKKLTDPYAPTRYYIRSTNTIVIADATSAAMGSATTLNPPGDVCRVLDVQPQRLRRIRRLILRKTTWR
jgi:hypothetical protein